MSASNSKVRQTAGKNSTITREQALEAVKVAERVFDSEYANRIASALIDVMVSDPGAGDSNYNYPYHLGLYEYPEAVTVSEFRLMLRELGWKDSAENETESDNQKDSEKPDRTDIQATMLEIEFSTPFKIAERALCEYGLKSLRQIRANQKDHKDLGIYPSDDEKYELFNKFVIANNKVENLIHAVILCDAVGRGTDFAKHFDLLYDNANTDEINGYIYEIALIYREFKRQTPAMPYDTMPGLREFSENIVEATQNYPEGYMINLAYPNLDIVPDAKKDKTDFGPFSNKSVGSQTEMSKIDVPQIMHAFSFLQPEIPESGRMVVVSHEMFGNEKITGRAVLEMARKCKISIIGTNPAMHAALDELRITIAAERADADRKLMHSIHDSVRVANLTSPQADGSN